MFDPKSKEALLKNLVDTWGPEGFATAAKMVAQYEESMTRPICPEVPAIQQDPESTDLQLIRKELINLIKSRRVLCFSLEGIHNRLDGTLSGSRKVMSIDKDKPEHDWDTVGLRQIIYILGSQASHDAVTINRIENMIGNTGQTGKETNA